MTYRANLWKLIFSPSDQLFRINKADKISRLFSLLLLLLLFSLLIYGGMAWLGIGTEALSPGAITVPREEYEAAKFSFLIGRLLYALLFSLLTLFLPALFFKLFFRINFSKAVLLQSVVMTIFLLEVVCQIPLYLYFGLDWYAVPFSFGPIMTVLTELPFWIYLGGTVTLFLLWIIWFQVYYLSVVTEAKKRWIWITVLFFHLVYVFGAASLSYYTTNLLTLILGGE